jgi:UDP-N-acetylglucosamine--N-acetylmuramyl-(pentapeptide) pyrophosphoryl-undecaprenol N-acetylglucosamine transferase
MPNKPLTVCLTGGGTAGHVTPHFALLPGIRQRGWRVFYIGSRGLEQPLVEAQGIEFKAVATGKLRRYLSVKNLVDLFKVGVGCLQAFWILLRRRPDAVFSKGGFVAVPVAWAAWALRIPVVSHESDVTPGLANKLIAPMAKQLLYTFPETAKYLGPRARGNARHVGTPVRAELFEGSRERAVQLCGFDPQESLPTYLVMGGSQGAQRINEALRESLPWLLERARVVHLTGKGKGLGFTHPRYKSFEFVSGELKDLFALSDFVVSRAGANSLFEFLALKKPMLLIPLEQGSRGDQVVNAESFARNGWALVLREKDLTPAAFQVALGELGQKADALRRAQQGAGVDDAAERILGAIAAAAGQG